MKPVEVEFAPITPVFGVEVRGLDLRAQLPLAVSQRLIDAFYEHQLLLFRDQDLGEDDLIRLASVFGEVTQFGLYGDRKYVSNVDPEGIFARGELKFHTDYSFAETPLRGLMFYGITVPPEGAGGDTLFTSVKHAFERLPQDLHERIHGRQITHITNTSKEAGTASTMIATHPIEFPHPKTGHKVVFVDPRHYDAIPGLSKDEGRRLCDDLAEFIADPRFVMTHVWRPGDCIVFDNINVQHARTEWDPKYPRHLRRIMIAQPAAVTA